MASSFAEIVEVLQLYLDGLYHSDTARLARAFHPEARYVCAVEEPPRMVRELLAGRRQPDRAGRPVDERETEPSNRRSVDALSRCPQ